MEVVRERGPSDDIFDSGPTQTGAEASSSCKWLDGGARSQVSHVARRTSQRSNSDSWEISTEDKLRIATRATTG